MEFFANLAFIYKVFITTGIFLLLGKMNIWDILLHPIEAKWPKTESPILAFFLIVVIVFVVSAVGSAGYFLYQIW